jgi:hypothetical protein
MPESGIDLLEWRELRRNSLCGFATVRLQQTGLVIADVALHQSHGRMWAALPSKPMLDRTTGQALRDANTGRVRYAPILEWVSRDVANRFSEAVVAEIERRYPGALPRDAIGATRVAAIA